MGEKIIIIQKVWQNATLSGTAMQKLPDVGDLVYYPSEQQVLNWLNNDLWYRDRQGRVTAVRNGRVLVDNDDVGGWMDVHWLEWDDFEAWAEEVRANENSSLP